MKKYCLGIVLLLFLLGKPSYSGFDVSGGRPLLFDSLEEMVSAILDIYDKMHSESKVSQERFSESRLDLIYQTVKQFESFLEDIGVSMPFEVHVQASILLGVTGGMNIEWNPYYEEAVCLCERLTAFLFYIMGLDPALVQMDKNLHEHKHFKFYDSISSIQRNDLRRAYLSTVSNKRSF